MRIASVARPLSNNANIATAHPATLFHKPFNGRPMKKFGLFVAAFVFSFLANLQSVDAQETCILPLDRGISDSEISNLFFGPNDPTSCFGKRDACQKVFDNCLSNFGKNEAGGEFLRTERQKICDRRIGRICLDLVSSTKTSGAGPTITSMSKAKSPHRIAQRQQVGSTDADSPFTWVIATTSFSSLLPTASGTNPIPKTIVIILSDENSDSAIDSKDLDIILGEQKDDDDDDDDDDEDDKDKDNTDSNQTIAQFRGKFEVFCSNFLNGEGPESCSWSSQQLVEYYNGNWTQFCSKDARETFESNGSDPPSKRKCNKCDPERGIETRDPVCLRLLFFTWPGEFGSVIEASPTPTRGLSFPQRQLGDNSRNSGAASQKPYIWVVALVWCLGLVVS